MAYQGQQNFDHRQAQKLGVLITNLGTPDLSLIHISEPRD